MRDWRAIYDSRVVTPEAAVALVGSGETLAVSSYGAEPQALVDALLARSDLTGITCYQAPRGTRGRLVAASDGTRIRFVTYAPDRATATSIANGNAEFFPASIYRACRWLVDGDLQIDTALVHLSRPDSDGFCSFGTSTDFTSLATQQAGKVIAELNDQMPATRGHERMHVSRLDAVVEVSRPLRAVEPPVPDPAAIAVGQHVAGLVPDGATIEVGVGAVPAAVLASLSGHRRLGIHTGLVSDSLAGLAVSGAVTGECKNVDTGVIVANQVTGTEVAYGFAARAAELEMRSALYTHDPLVMGSLDNFVAINSAIQIDLRGQVNSEWLAGRQVSGTGGSIDFAMGATYSRGGKSIIAVTSAAGDGKYSKIVPELEHNATVTIPAIFVDYVVTEFGVARLAGCTASERARALVAVAHPDHRDRLTRHLDR